MLRIHIQSIFLASFLLLKGGASAEDILPVQIGEWASGGNDLVVCGDLLYLASGAGLEIVDISDLSQPIPIGGYDTLGNANCLVVEHNLVFLADGNEGLQIIDVSNPSSPEWLGGLNTPSQALELVVIGNTVFVADEETGLIVIDVADPRSPTQVGLLELPTKTVSIDSDGSYIFLFNSGAHSPDGFVDGQGLVAVDISIPSSPSVLDSFPFRSGDRVSVFEHRAYVAAGFSGLVVFDISDPSNLTGANVNVENSFGGNWFYEFAVSDGLIFRVYNEDPLTINRLEKSTGASPVIATIPTIWWFNEVFVSGDNAFIAEEGRISIWDLSRLANPQRAGAYPEGVVRENILYQWGGEIFDISDIQNPSLISAVAHTGYSEFVAVEGNYLYLLASNIPGLIGEGLLVVDVANPETPARVGELSDAASWPNVRGCAVIGEHLYVFGHGDMMSWLRIVDVSNPVSPELVNEVALPNYFQSSSLRGNILYLFDRDGIRIVNVANPVEPVFIGSYPLSSPGSASDNDILIRGSHLFAAAGENGVVVLDITIPDDPQHVTTFTNEQEAVGIDVVGDYVHVVWLHGGVTILNVSDMSNPVVVGRNTSVTEIHKVSALNEFSSVVRGQLMVAHPFIQSITHHDRMMNVSWESFGNAQLQRATSLTNPDWQTLNGSEQVDQISLPMWSGPEFFRLVRP